MRRFFLFLIILVLLASCTSMPKYKSYVSIKGADCPQAQFAAQEIALSLDGRGIGLSDSEPQWTIRFADIDLDLGEQSYHIEVLGRIIEITGGDERGLMYGGLEVAEQIKLYGIERLSESSGSPYLPDRGTKFNIPLDLRTPSYSDAGDVAQSNIDDMWDIEFWHEYIDELARDRYTFISICSLNPFPSMVKVPEYPDVALDDVWRSTIPFDESYSGRATDMMRPEHWENYEIVKKITIDEKIEFWREVMQYAADHGIDFYIYVWNCYTFAENGKYGITPEMDNQIARDYYRCSVRELIKTYPLLKGIGVTAGEQLNNNPEFISENEEWLFDTFGRGIMAALENEPDREFFLMHRLHDSNVQSIKEQWSDFTGILKYSNPYSGAHMYSVIEPHGIDSVLKELDADDQMWMELRNDDLLLRWGDSEYAREYLKKVPEAGGRVQGFFMGCDTYTPGRDFNDKDPEKPNQLYVKKHWINYMLFGRLAYNPELCDKLFADIISYHYGGRDGDLILKTLQVAGKILPLENQQVFYGFDTWYPVGNYSTPDTFGYYDIGKLMKNNQVLSSGIAYGIADSAKAALNGTEIPEGKKSAFEIADMLEAYGNKVLELSEIVLGEKVSGKTAKETEKDFRKLISDQMIYAYLGKYYANKNRGALYLRMFNETSDELYREKAVAALIHATEDWRSYCSLYTSLYTDELLCRDGYFSPEGIILPQVEAEIDFAKNWKPRKMK